ncbi:hypothetical protein LINPERHAP1_LOCUS469 [Linum perenne]
MAYIREPTALEYGTLDMYAISSSDCGQPSDDSLKCAAKGVLTGFASCMLKRRRTFSIYLC